VSNIIVKKFLKVSDEIAVEVYFSGCQHTWTRKREKESWQTDGEWEKTNKWEKGKEERMKEWEREREREREHNKKHANIKLVGVSQRESHEWKQWYNFLQRGREREI
jgi:hypothetical protein